MTCDDVLNAVEPIAAGERQPDAWMASHLSTCVSCASALDAARRLDALLRQRLVPMPSPHFTTRTMARIRRARWHNEQVIDWAFNAGLALVALATMAGIWIIISRSGFTLTGNDALQLLGAGMRTLVQRVSPSLPLYALATVLLITALGIWWWAERDATL
jgi:predicted anti-sigma-YlaC factor YlaD